MNHPPLHPFNLINPGSMLLRVLQASRLFRPILLLFVFSGFCIVMLLTRTTTTGSYRYWFLAWNLILAWIPLGIVLLLISKPLRRWQYLAGLSVWLLFLPNSPYIITDLLHLRKQTQVALWFDSLLIFSYAMAGLQAGLFSLYLAHQLINRLFGVFRGYFIVAGCVLLSGYGVYLGRFQRWNSWDLVTHPLQLLPDLLRQLTNPTAIKMTLLFACLLAFFYLLFLSLVQVNTYEVTRSGRE